MVVHKSDSAKSDAKIKSTGRIWPDWYPVLATSRNSDNRKAAWQLINTIVPYCGLWYLMIRSIEEPRSVRSTAAWQNLRGMFCLAAEPTGNALAISVQH
jgi:hypothetical protein